jgi:HlyD family secretion protein
MKVRWWGVAAAALAVGGGAAFLLLRGRKDEVRWRTAKVDRGSITQRITATGTLNALIQVPVGTQVSGVVTALSADFNSLVKKGQVIAQIDPTTFQIALKDAQANLQRCEASLANAQADFKRNQELARQQLLSASDLEAKQLALQLAQGNLESARATLANAKANLEHCTITAPVDGVVVARAVDVGQTVAASFSTPNLFTIAQDLAHMKVQAAIDEADIGQVRVGQRAFFTVDSYPDKQFRGQVSEVQLNPTVNNNVVTYNVVMEVANEPRQAYVQDGGADPGRRRGFDPGAAGPGAAGPGAAGPGAAGAGGDHAGSAKLPGLEYTTARYIPAGAPVYRGELALFPGMTANCTVVTNRRDDVLRVPSAALRFNPAAFMPMIDAKGGTRPAAAVTPGPGGPGASGGGGRGMVARRDDKVWILVDGRPKPVPVKAGASDGSFTEVSGDGIGEGLEVLTGIGDFKKSSSQGPSGSPLGGGGMRH